MAEIAAEQYIGSLYGTGQDAGAALTAMCDAVPDFSTIRFNRLGGVLSLTTPWLVRGKTGLNILGPVLVEELPQLTLQDSGIDYSPQYSGAAMVILDSCGHCEFSGFQLKAFNRPVWNTYGIQINSVSGGRISTNNTIAYNRLINAGNPTWWGISIAKWGFQNNEAMQLLHNWIDGNGMGTGILVGDNSNNHMHYMFRNTTYKCAKAVDGAWSGFHSSHHVSEGDEIVFSIGHMSYPCLIEYTDAENSRQIVVAGHEGGESALIMRAGRHASCGGPGLPMVDIGPYLSMGEFTGNDWQNYSGNGSFIYQVPIMGPGKVSIRDSFQNWLSQGGSPSDIIRRSGQVQGGAQMIVDMG